MEHTVRGLLKIFGDIFGMQFLEVPPGDQHYQTTFNIYLKTRGLKNADLDVFCISDITGFTSKPIGFLILDLKERDGKAASNFCTTFNIVRSSSFRC